MTIITFKCKYDERDPQEELPSPLPAWLGLVVNYQDKSFKIIEKTYHADEGTSGYYYEWEEVK